MPYALYRQVWGWIRYSKIQGLKQSHQGLVCLPLPLPYFLPPSLPFSVSLFLSSLLCYLHDQTASILMVTRWLSAALSLPSCRKKSPRKALLPSISSKTPEPSLRLSLRCVRIQEAIMAAKQVEYSDWPGWVVFPPLVLGVRQAKWTESWGWASVQNKVKVWLPDSGCWADGNKGMKPRHLLQCGGTLKTRSWVQETTTCVILSIRNMQSRKIHRWIARDWREGGMGSNCWWGWGSPLGVTKYFETRGDDCTTSWMNECHWIVCFKMVDFMLCELEGQRDPWAGRPVDYKLPTR